MIGYGWLDPLVEDKMLEEIMVVATKKPVYVYHRKFGMCITNIIFDNDDEIVNIINRIARSVNRRIDQQSPLLDARLVDGSRVNATIPPISLDGPTLTIRLFSENPLTVTDLLRFGTMSSELAAFLWTAVDGYFGVKPQNCLVAGGTGSGKTTTLNSLAVFIPAKDRIITIEDTAELVLKPHEHWIRFETRPPNVEGKGEITMDDLVKNTLRMRPDRLIVGEVRGSEAETLFVAMNTGHDGCMGTLHANTAKETITRLTSPPMNVPKIMVPALDFILMQARVRHKTKGLVRRVIEVAEIAGMEGDTIQLNQTFKWNPKADVVNPSGVPSRVRQNMAEYAGITGDELNMEVKRRQAILEWLVKKGINSVERVGETVQTYYLDPDAFIEMIIEDVQGG